MKNWFRKGISILCIIALLISGIAAAYASDENASDNNEAVVTDQAADEAAEEAARQAAEEAERKAAEEAERKAAEEEAARRAAEEEAARKAAEEEAARKAAEEEAARKAAEEEAARKAAEEEAARQAAEEEAAAQTAAADEEATDTDTSDDNEEWEEDPDAEYEIFEDGDEGFVTPEAIAQNVPAVTPEIIEASAVEDEEEEQKEETEPETEAVPEMKELKVGKKVSGTVKAGEDFYICLFADTTETIVLSLSLNAGDAVSVTINGQEAKFSAVANPDPASTDAIYSYGLNAQAGKVYDIVLNANTNTSFKMKAEVLQEKIEKEENDEDEEDTADEGTKEEAKTEEPAVADTTTETVTTEDKTEGTEGTEQTTETAEGTEETEQTAEGTEGTEQTAEAEIPAAPIHGWVTIDAETVSVGDQVTLQANADADLEESYIIWQTKAADEENWTKIGYSKTMVLDVTEENINNFFRFKIADDNFSDTFKLVTEAAAEEETEVEAVEETAEETAEGTETDTEEEKPEEAEGETAEDVESEEETAEETEEITETTEDAALGYVKVTVNEEGADVFESTEEGAEAVAHLEAGTEILVKAIDETWATLYNEAAATTETAETAETTEQAEAAEITEVAEQTVETTAEPSARYIKLSNVTTKAEETTEEETEETAEGTEEVQEETEKQQAVTEEFVLPEGASVSFEIKWDGTPAYGETAHFVAAVTGLEEYEYTLQWQSSTDDLHWENIEGETNEVMDILATVEANKLFYRVIALVQQPLHTDAAEETVTESETADEAVQVDTEAPELPEAEKQD